MSYRQDSFFYRNKTQTHWKKNVVICVVIVFLFLAGNKISGGLFFQPIAFIAKPIWSSNNSISIGLYNFFQSFETKNNLIENNKKLTQENLKLKILLLNRNSVVKENQELKKLLGRQNSEDNPVVAEIIFTPNNVPYNTLILDVGAQNSTKSIKVGDLVVAWPNILLGEVVEVFATKSKVSLLSSGTEDLPVLISENNVPAIAKGTGGGNFSVTLPKDVLIKEGDRVVSSQFNHYTIGVVDVIKKKNSDPFQTILFKLPINIFQLKWVEIYASEN